MKGGVQEMMRVRGRKLLACLISQTGQIVFGCGLMLVFFCPAFGGSDTHKSTGKPSHVRQEQKSFPRPAGNTQTRTKGARKKYSYQEKELLKQKAKKFKTMPPSQQQELRHKMDRFNKLPPEKQKIYRKRFNQMQRLPPSDQRKIRNKLHRMDRLSPKEKEEIRKKFQ